MKAGRGTKTTGAHSSVTRSSRSFRYRLGGNLTNQRADVPQRSGSFFFFFLPQFDLQPGGCFSAACDASLITPSRHRLI